MTDKQIINGVNINECDNHYIKNNKHICKYNFEECNPKKEQCSFYVTSIEVQLKHKEQECKELKNKIELLEEELSVIQHNCNREGCKYYDDDTFKVFYECKAQKALQLSANSVTTKYCDLLKTLAEIKEIAKYDVYTTRADLCLRLNWIKKKISECEVKND